MGSFRLCWDCYNNPAAVTSSRIQTHAPTQYSRFLTISPSSGMDVRRLDSTKVAKALKHYLVALSFRPASKSLHVQVGKLYHDACRFREGLPFLKTAQSTWPDDLVLRHNLAVMTEKAIMTEMRVDRYITVRHRHTHMLPLQLVQKASTDCCAQLSFLYGYTLV